MNNRTYLIISYVEGWNQWENGSWSSQLDSKGIKSIIIGVCAGPNSSSMGYTIEAMKRVMLDHGVEVMIEESYYGTRRNPVENNMEIREKITRKCDKVFNHVLINWYKDVNYKENNSI